MNYTMERQAIKPIFMFPRRLEVEASNDVIIRTLLVYDPMTSLLFNTRSTFSYVSFLLTNGLNLHYDLLNMPIRVSSYASLSVLV